MYCDVTRDLLYIFLQPFLYLCQGSYHYRYCWGFHPYILSISMSRSLYFDCFSVTLTEVFFSKGMVISMNRQLFVLSVLDYNVWSNGFISQSVCIGISHKIMMLSFSVTVWGSSSYHFSFLLISDYIHLFCCNWPLKLCSPYSPMCAFLDISQSSLWNVITICFILPLSLFGLSFNELN